MENASKALLIAAAVLIVIILIAFGMSVLNSPKDTVEHAQGVGDSISDASQIALGKLDASLNKGQTIDVSSMLTEEQKRGDADITSAQLAKIILGDENKSLGTYNGDWRVIGADGNKFKIVSTDNVVSNVTLGGNTLDEAIDSYINVVEILDNKTREELKNIKDKVRINSLKVEDLNTLLEKTPGENNSYYDKEYEYYISKYGTVYCRGQYRDNSTSFKIKAYKAIEKNEKLCTKTDDGILLKNTTYNYDINNYGYLTNSNYWLMSQSVTCNNDRAYFNVRVVYEGSMSDIWLFETSQANARKIEDICGVRAVVLI